MVAPAVSCPAPFLAESAHPYTAGLRSGRFCGPFAPGVSCCLPCPLEGLVYSNAFQRNLRIAYWFNVPALICQVFLLASFAVLKEKHSHAHYLSIGLCISLALLEVCACRAHIIRGRSKANGKASSASSYLSARSRTSVTIRSRQTTCTPI